MAKRFFSVIAGLIAGGIVIYLIQMISARQYPLPPELDPADVEAMKEHIAGLPVGAFLYIILAWAMGALVGGFIAGIIIREKAVLYAVIIGAILMSFGFINLIMVPHPVWFWFAGMAVFLPFAWLGGKLGSMI